MTTIQEQRRHLRTAGGPEPMLAGEETTAQAWLVKVFAIVPLLALVVAMPFAWGWGLSWIDVSLAAFFYTLTCLGVTVGFHRYFTHGAFKAKRGLRIALGARRLPGERRLVRSEVEVARQVHERRQLPPRRHLAGRDQLRHLEHAHARVGRPGIGGSACPNCEGTGKVIVAIRNLSPVIDSRCCVKTNGLCATCACAHSGSK